MKKTRLLYIALLLIPGFLLLSNGFAQKYIARWHLPKGAKARLGGGRLINIKLSPDSTRVAVPTSIGIWLYDAHTGEAVSLFTGIQTGEMEGFLSTEPPEALTFSADALVIASAHENSIYVWDTETGTAFAMLDEHPASINALALSPDGTRLATAGGDWTVRLWDAGTGKYINSMTGHPSAVNAVAFSPDGKILASAGSTLRLWDAATGELLHADSTDLGSIELLVFSPDGKILASGGGWDHAVQLWDVETGTLRTSLKGHTGKTRSMAFSRDGNTLVTASSDKTMRLWNMSTGTEEKKFPTPKGERPQMMPLVVMLKELDRGVLPRLRDDVFDARFSKDGKQLVSVSSDSSLHLWDIDTNLHQRSFALGAHASWISVLAFSADSKYLASDSGLEERIRVWDVETATQHTLLTPSQHNILNPILNLTVSPDIKKLASHDFHVQVWNATTKEHLSTLQETDRWHQYWPLVFSPDGHLLAARQKIGSNKVVLWQTDTGVYMFTFEGHTAPVSEYIFSPDSTFLASGDEDGTVILWDVKTGRRFSSFTGHTERISALAFSPDSKTLASGSENEIRLWNVHSGNFTLDAVQKAEALAFSPDGKTLVSGTEDGLIQIWELTPNYQIQATFRGHRGTIYALMFSPDGKTLASGGVDGTILLWDMER